MADEKDHLQGESHSQGKRSQAPRQAAAQAGAQHGAQARGAGAGSGQKSPSQSREPQASRPQSSAPQSGGPQSVGPGQTSHAGLQESIEARLCAYIDGDLDEAGRAMIEKHLAANVQHRQVLEELRRQRQWIVELPRVRAPLDINEMLHAQLERSALLGDGSPREADVVARINRWPQIVAAAAIVLLAVGLGVVIYSVLPKGIDSGSKSQVAIGNQADKNLSDEKSEGLSEDQMKAAPATTSPAPSMAAGTGAGAGGAPDAFSGTQRGARRFAKMAGLDFGSQQKASARPAVAVNSSTWLVVDSADVRAANQRLAQYLQKNGIEYRVDDRLAQDPSAQQLGRQLAEKLAGQAPTQLAMQPNSQSDSPPNGDLTAQQTSGQAPVQQRANPEMRQSKAAAEGAGGGGSNQGAENAQDNSQIANNDAQTNGAPQPPATQNATANAPQTNLQQATQGQAAQNQSIAQSQKQGQEQAGRNSSSPGTAPANSAQPKPAEREALANADGNSPAKVLGSAGGRAPVAQQAVPGNGQQEMNTADQSAVQPHFYVARMSMAQANQLAEALRASDNSAGAADNAVLVYTPAARSEQPVVSANQAAAPAAEATANAIAAPAAHTPPTTAPSGTPSGASSAALPATNKSTPLLHPMLSEDDFVNQAAAAGPATRLSPTAHLPEAPAPSVASPTPATKPSAMVPATQPTAASGAVPARQSQASAPAADTVQQVVIVIYHREDEAPAAPHFAK